MLIHAINRQAASFYEWWLGAERSKRKREYADERGLDEATRKKFQIGAAPKYGSTLYKHLVKHYRRDDILESGLCILKEDGTIVDKFYSRLMFPIKDPDGNITGFGGRLIAGEGPKYLNSAQSDAFKKSENLYGIDIAKDARSDCFIVCEGYMDVIALHKAGFSNAVASLGTAITQEQIMLMARFRKRAILIYDSDEAGLKAAEKAAELCKEGGITCRVLMLPYAKDPDEFLKNHSAAELSAIIRKSSVPGDIFRGNRAMVRYLDEQDIGALSDHLISIFDGDADRILRFLGNA